MVKLEHGELERLFRQHQRGGIARLNHSVLDRHCDGESRSMKVSVKSDGSLSWTCFRCQEHGVTMPSAVARRLAAEYAADEQEEDSREWRYELPAGQTHPKDWALAARDWLLRYVNVSTATRYGAVEAHGRLWLPVHKDGHPVKWAGRRLYNGDSVKYLTGHAPGYRVHELVYPEHGVRHGPAVITEDIVSAWSIAEKLGLPALPLMSVSMSKWQSAFLYTELAKFGVHDVVVWLDNDNSSVNKAARRAVRDLRGYGLSVHRESELGDPKTVLATQAYSWYNECVGSWRQSYA